MFELLQRAASALRQSFARTANALRLDREEVLVEQLRLIYSSMTVSVLPMFPAIFIVTYTLYSYGNRKPLIVWLVAAILTNGFSMLDARRHLARGFTAEQAPKLVRRLFLSLAIAGFVWGALIWGALGRSTETGNVIVIGVVAGILGGGLALLSPIFPSFLAFAIPLIGAALAGIWSNPDPAYRAFGLIAVLYLGALVGQARMSALTARTAIALRFENLALARKEQQARLDAEEANRAKSSFLAAASHDLRQPVHAQGLFLSVLMRTALTDQQRHLVSQVGAARDATAEMLNVLLDFSRVQAGVLKPELKPFDARQLLHKLEREFADQADMKGLEYRSREPTLRLFSDPALVELILRNLISNAIRYTDRGDILVTCRRRGDHAVVAVYDTGIGIAKENHAEIFKEFRQLDNPERDRRKGLGLGLAIANNLARSLQHVFELKSVRGRGSVFQLQVPIADDQRVCSDLAPHTHAQQSISEQPEMLPISARILVIDDEPNVLAGMVALLESWGCTCATAESIAQAVQIAPTFAPDMLISDYRLRDSETGLAAIKCVRASLFRAVPALLITGDTAPERLNEAMGGGIPLLHKPVATHDLYAALRREMEIG